MARISTFLCALGLALVGSVAAADDIKGKVTAVDLDKRTIALKVGEQDQTLDLAERCKVYKLAGGRKGSGYNEAPDGLKALAVGDDVTATSDFLDGKEQVIRIKIETPAKKRKRLGRDVSGKVAALDAEKRTIALTIDDKEQKFELARDCNVFKLVGGGARAHFEPATDGLAEVKVGTDVTINLDTRDGREQVVYIQIGPPRKPKGK